MIGAIADETDVVGLAALHASCFDRAWDAQTIADLLCQAPVFALAARDGFILARATADEAEILTLAVVPAARRHGLGSALVRAAAARAHAMRAHKIYLEVGRENIAARALYENLGFSPIGTRKAYYPGGEDALVLKAGLPLSDLGKTG